MPNLLTGVLVPPSHLGKANAHLAKKITKPFVKAARFISKQLNLVQVKPQNSYSQPKKTQLSKAAQNLLNETKQNEAKFRPKSSRLVARVHSVTASNHSITSKATVKANNTSKAPIFLRDIALNPPVESKKYATLSKDQQQELMLAKHTLSPREFSRTLHESLKKEYELEHTSKASRVSKALELLQIDQNNQGPLTVNILRAAVKEGDIAALKAFLQNVNLADQVNRPVSRQLLKLAARRGEPEVLKLLLQQDWAQIDAKLEKNLLLIAGEYNNNEIVDFLLADKALLSRIYSPRFVQTSVEKGLGYLSSALIKETRFLNTRDDAGYVRFCVNYAELAIKSGHQKLVPDIMQASGYVPGENQEFDYDILNYQISSFGSSNFTELLIQNEHFNPSVYENLIIQDALRLELPDVVMTLLKDIRIHRAIYGYYVDEIRPFLSLAIQDLKWQPKFDFKELLSVIESSSDRNSLGQSYSECLLPAVLSALKVRQNKAFVEAEKLSKVFFAKGFDVNFVLDKVTQLYGKDLFVLHESQTHKQSISKLVRRWENEQL